MIHCSLDLVSPHVSIANFQGQVACRDPLGQPFDQPLVGGGLSRLFCAVCDVLPLEHQDIGERMPPAGETLPTRPRLSLMVAGISNCLVG